MNVIDVYDIAQSKWYKQSTSGSTPKFRVNPCAVVAAAAEYVLLSSYLFISLTFPQRFFLQYVHVWRPESSTGCRANPIR